MEQGAIRVLHVEDDPPFAALTADYLERAGFDVATETEPERALDRLAAEPVDCVVSDYEMPSMDGLELLERVRERHPDLPFVLFTGEGSESIASDAIAAGVDEYVEKTTGTEHFDLLASRVESAVEQYRTETRLARTEERYQRLLETAPTPIVIFDETEVKFVNDAAVAFLEADDAGDLVGSDPRRFFDSDETGAVAERMARVLRDRESLDPREYELETFEGEARYAVMRSAPVTFEGEPAGQVVINDVTEYREARAELEREKRTLEAAVDAIDDLFFILDEAGQPIRWNDRVNEVTGYDDDQIAGMSMEEFFAESEASAVRERIESLLADGGTTTVEADVETAAGGTTPFEFRGVRMVDDDGEVVGACGIGRDVGDQRAYERELERYRALIETMGDPMYVVDDSGELLQVNQALVEQSGYEREELVGAPVTRFMAHEDVQQVTELVWDILTDPDRSSGVVEFELEDAAGRTRIVEDSVSVLTDDDGEYVCTVGVLHDVTQERVRKRQLRRQNERLDRFASLVSHDLRNPLNVIQGFVDVAEESGDPEAFDRVRSATDRMESIIEDMLLLARHGTVVDERETVELATAARDAWAGVHTADADLRVTSERTVEADPERLSALFENLFRNAVDHGGADVTVRTEGTGSGFAVADDGDGLPGDREDLFEYGVSHGNGTGLGLAIVAEICEAHGWAIEAGDDETGGARFEITT